MGPKILVTGANGYTGYWFTKFLIEKNWPVRAMYYGPDGKPDLSGPGLELVAGDIRNRKDIEAALPGIETVYHIAALYRPTNVPNQAFWDVNVEGTRNMVELAAKFGVARYVHCSTIGVHGTVGRTPVNEDGPIRPDDYYQHSKWEGEKLALELAKKLNLKLSVIRPAGIYGPREKRFLKITQLVAKKRFIMFGDGQTYHHFIHVRDLSEAFVLAATRPEAVGRAYIIADDHAISIGHFVNCLADAAGVSRPNRRLPYWMLKTAAVACEMVFKPLGMSPPMHRRRAAWFVSNRTFAISRAKSELGYSPKVKIEDGLADMVQSYKEMKWI